MKKATIFSNLKTHGEKLEMRPSNATQQDATKNTFPNHTVINPILFSAMDSHLCTRESQPRLQISRILRYPCELFADIKRLSCQK